VDSDAQPALREEALFKLGFYQKRLGDSAAARASWLRYQHEFPQGLHALLVSSELDQLHPR
jgi:hypothetical protein